MPESPLEPPSIGWLFGVGIGLDPIQYLGSVSDSVDGVAVRQAPR